MCPLDKCLVLLTLSFHLLSDLSCQQFIQCTVIIYLPICLQMPWMFRFQTIQCNLKGICLQSPFLFEYTTLSINWWLGGGGPTSAKARSARFLLGGRLNWTRQDRYLQIKTTTFLPGFHWGPQGPKREVNYTSHLEFLECHKKKR